MSDESESPIITDFSGSKSGILEKTAAKYASKVSTVKSGIEEELDEREREIIELRYGMRGGTELTQKEVADRLGISQSYISRLEKRIIVKLKKQIEKAV